MTNLLNLAGNRRSSDGLVAAPVQKIVLLAGKRIPECDVIEACTTAAAISATQGIATQGRIGPEWDGWHEAGMKVEIYLANRSDFASVRKAAFDAGSTTVEVGEASAVAFSPAEASLVPPRLQILVADFAGRRVVPRKRVNASGTPLVVWDASMHTAEVARVCIQAMHRWVRAQKPPVLVRWFNKGCRTSVIGLEGERATHMLTYGVDPGTGSRGPAGVLRAGVCSPPLWA